MSRSRSLLFVAEGASSSGVLERVWAYKQGRSYYLAGPGASDREHLCHPSVKDRTGIRREIYLVFQIRMGRVLEPHELIH